ncbi:MAG TPA: NADH-quinone oxidoreductase subunit NuoG [Candidatus Dormibacteraeota bacterium]|nr:NADH-quinone oxidoreductase subunit NuoG [Candidatus Dormibacteraeota bacterium]
MTAVAETGTPPEQLDDGRVGISIDGRELRVAKGTLVLDAATEAGIHIPIYCAHPKMDPVAVCRMCLVNIEKFPKPQPACATIAGDGMVVRTDIPEVTKLREGMLEFLLLNHPLDCPVCDRGGECDLQDFTFRYGPGISRFPITEKVHFKKAVPLSEHIELDQERCILCWRCVRYYDEITGEKEIVLQQRGVDTLVATFDDRQLESKFQGNLPEVCPVGALTHRKYRFVSRPWDLQRTASICPECSYGCNINVDSRDFEVRRFASRDNPLVDDMWLCDRGRYSFDRWNTSERVRRPVLRSDDESRDVTVPEAITQAARRLREIAEEYGAESIGVIGSSAATNEELFLLERLARQVIGTPHIDHQLEPFDGLSAAEHELGIAEIEDCDALVVLGAEPEEHAPVLTLRLYKAERKKGARVIRLRADVAAAEAVAAVSGASRIGLIADETNRAHAADLSTALGAVGMLRRLTITRGMNGRGAKDLGLLPNVGPGYASLAEPGMNGRQILEGLAAGSMRGLVMLGPNPALEAEAELLERAVRKAACVVAFDTRPGVVSRYATVLFPGHAVFEKAGSVTNVEGRVQRIRAGLPPASASPVETRVLTSIAGEMGAVGWGSGDPLAVNRLLRDEFPAYGRAGNGGRALFTAEAVA